MRDGLEAARAVLAAGDAVGGVPDGAAEEDFEASVRAWGSLKQESAAAGEGLAGARGEGGPEGPCEAEIGGFETVAGPPRFKGDVLGPLEGEHGMGVRAFLVDGRPEAGDAAGLQEAVLAEMADGDGGGVDENAGEERAAALPGVMSDERRGTARGRRAAG